jgi:hypothetical protein
MGTMKNKLLFLLLFAGITTAFGQVSNFDLNKDTKTLTCDGNYGVSKLLCRRICKGQNCSSYVSDFAKNYDMTYNIVVDADAPTQAQIDAAKNEKGWSISYFLWYGKNTPLQIKNVKY